MASKPRSITHLPAAAGYLPHDAEEQLRRAVAHRFDRNGNWIDSTAATRETAAPLQAAIDTVRATHPERFL